MSTPVHTLPAASSAKGTRVPPALAVLAAVLASVILISTTSVSSAFEPWWVQAHSDTQFWSGQDNSAIAFGPVARGTSLLVIAPQRGPRLYVQDPRTGNVAYVDASAVGPIGTPRLSSLITGTPAGPEGLKRTPPQAPAGFTPFWVANYEETDLWTGPETWAASRGSLPQFRRSLVIEPQKGSKLKVWVPEIDAIGYVSAASVGPVGPSAWLEPHPLKITRQVRMPGRVCGDTAFVRNLPVVSDETELRHIPNNGALEILAAGTARDGTEWYSVGDGMYVKASEMRLPTPPPGYREGRWIDADLTTPAMVTAYEGDRIVYTALAIIGKDATPTLLGNYQILRRVENETMDSSTLGIPREDPKGYYLEDVLYTQYFTPQGAAIHYNYWLGTFGQPGSHGCLGLNLEDSLWFWEWATVGTPVIVR